MTTPRNFGWLKDPPDYRDHVFSLTAPPVASELPDVVDLRSGMPKVRDQGDLGSCTAHATNAVVEYVEKHDKDPDRDALSRLWTYYYSREKIGTVNEDSGAHLRDAFKVVAERGAPRERYWPYDVDRYKEKPTAGERSAPHHRVLEYMLVEDESETAMRACLAAGYPFAYGFAVYESFLDIDDDGYWPGDRGSIIGYHAVVCVGYTETDWIVRNSWSTQWGDGGHFYVPRDYLPDEAYDCWTVRRVTVDP